MDSTASISLLTDRVRRTYQRALRRDWSSVLRFLAACTLFGFFAMFVIDRVTLLPAPVRVLLTLGTLAGIWGKLRSRQSKALSRSTDLEQMAREVEKRARRARPGGLQSILVSATEFGVLGRTPGSAELRQMVLERAGEADFDPSRWVLHRKDAEIRSWKLLGAALALHLLWAAVSPASMAVFARRALGLSVAYPTRTVITQITAPAAVARFEDVRFVVEADGVLPAQGVLKISYPGGRPFELPLTPDGEAVGQYVALLERPPESFTFRTELGDARGRPQEVKVLIPPMLVSGEITLHFPSYLKRAPARRPLGNVQLWRGGAFDVEIQTEGAVEQGLFLMGGETYPMEKTDGGFRIQAVTPQEPGPFSVRLVGANGLESPRRTGFHLTMLEDEAPLVDILAPAQGGYLSPPSLIRWRFRAKDDLGLRTATLRATLVQPEVIDSEGQVLTPARVLKTVDLPLGDLGGVGEMEREGSLAAETLDLRPGINLQLQIGVSDEAPRRGPADGWSEAVTLQVVSADDLRRILAEELLGTHRMIQDIREDIEDQRSAIEMRIDINTSAGERP